MDGKTVLANIKGFFYIVLFIIFRPLYYILPFGLFLRIIGFIGRFSAPLYAKRKSAGVKALEELQGLTHDEAEKAITDGLRNASLFVFLDFICDKWTSPRVKKHTLTEGREELEKAFSGGNGVLLTYVHSNTFNMALPCAGDIRHTYPLVVLENRGFLSAVHARIRGHLWESVPTLTFTYLDRGDNATLKIKNFLKQGEVVAITADGLHTSKFVSLSFFGSVLQLPMGSFRLSTIFNAPIVPLFSGVDWEKGKFRLSFGKPILKKTALEAAEAFAAQFQAHLARHPADWSGWWRMKPAGDEKASNAFSLYSVR
jgi:lauroyl/myristoyl acyltransferase